MSELVSSLAAADKQLGEGSEGKVLAGTFRSEPMAVKVEVVTPIDGGPQNINVYTACVMPLALGSLHDLLLKLENCQSLPLALVVDVCIQGQADSSPVQGVVDEVLELQRQLAASSVQLAAARAGKALLEEEIQQLRLRLQQQLQLEADRQQQCQQVVMQLQQQVVKLQTEVQSVTAANNLATQQAEAALQQLHQVSHLAEATRVQQRACKHKQQQVWEAEVQQQRSRAERAEAQLHQLLSTLAIIYDPTALSWCNAASSSSSGGNTPLRISLGGSDNCGVHQTFITACSSVAFTGGFASFLTALDRVSYTTLGGEAAPGNRAEDVYEPTIGRVAEVAAVHQLQVG
ncbi:protein YELLOW STRIPE LIKE 6 [Haematococcus lacustris]|uniref:Protein YELLOW STRIPE LIKE 6 n=1 Tax=Haematococcus lacustris TaxID=44745 RepID=A0A699Z8L1_HAELA|nr:protein YELLOW STRIPE LIKE 6 [Haematococcus lacustris]